MSTSADSMNIKDTSKLTGLSPSVLRIWELRYGWPNPKRKSNGYRTYQQHQVDELKRVAGFVKDGVPISRLIVDGLPRWPTSDMTRPASRALVRARALPAPTDAAEAKLFAELIDAIETHRSPMVRQVLQRIFWSVRPSDEPKVALIPTLVALTELRNADRMLPETGEVIGMIKERCVQLLRMQRIPSDALLVVPARGGDDALAVLTAVVLCYRGIPAKPWTELREPPSAYVLVSDAETMPSTRQRQIGCVSTMGGNGIISLPELADASKPVAWLATPAEKAVQA